MSLQSEFSSFSSRFGRSHAHTAERQLRLEAFHVNLVKSKLHALIDGSATYSASESPLGDWTAEELRQLFTAQTSHDLPRRSPVDEGVKPASLPKDFSWRDRGAVTGIRNQGSSSASWAFAAASIMESAHFLQSGNRLELSTQKLVECSDARDAWCGDHRCVANNLEDSFEILKVIGAGIEEELGNEYRAPQGCRNGKAREVGQIIDWQMVQHRAYASEDVVGKELMTHGPMAIAINADFLLFYRSGIARPSSSRWRGWCDTAKLNHAVVLVGFGTEDGVKYWTIKNSFGDAWGESGYFRLERGVGACGVNAMVLRVMYRPKRSSLLV